MTYLFPGKNFMSKQDPREISYNFFFAPILFFVFVSVVKKASRLITGMMVAPVAFSLYKAGGIIPSDLSVTSFIN